VVSELGGRGWGPVVSPTQLPELTDDSPSSPLSLPRNEAAAYARGKKKWNSNDCK
jgi:hypothetical protein